jgi:hypothetical protein
MVTLIDITSMVQCFKRPTKMGCYSLSARSYFGFRTSSVYTTNSRKYSQDKKYANTDTKVPKTRAKSHYPFQRTCSIATVSSTNRLLQRLLVTACSRLAKSTMEMNCKATELLAEQSLSSQRNREHATTQNVRWKQGSQRHDVLAKRYFFGVG